MRERASSEGWTLWQHGQSGGRSVSCGIGGWGSGEALESRGNAPEQAKERVTRSAEIDGRDHAVGVVAADADRRVGVFVVQRGSRPDSSGRWAEPSVSSTGFEVDSLVGTSDGRVVPLSPSDPRVSGGFIVRANGALERGGDEGREGTEASLDRGKDRGAADRSVQEGAEAEVVRTMVLGNEPPPAPRESVQASAAANADGDGCTRVFAVTGPWACVRVWVHVKLLCLAAAWQMPCAYT